MLSVDLDSNTVRLGGQDVRLTPQEAEILYTLVEAEKRGHRVVTFERMEHAIYGHLLSCDMSMEPLNSVKVMLVSLRRKLDKHGYGVGSVYDKGWYLFEKDVVEYTVVYGDGAVSGVAHVTACGIETAKLKVINTLAKYPLAIFRGRHENLMGGPLKSVLDNNGKV